jgi:hypothetical protein
LLWWYDSKELYSILLRRHPLSSILNARWVSVDLKVRWIHWLHNVWPLHLSHKLCVFAWLVIYQGLPLKAYLAKSGLTDGLWPCCSCLETLKRILWECNFARSHWWLVQHQHSVLLQGHLHWHVVFLGDSGSLVSYHFLGIWDYVKVITQFTIWNLRCKYVFSDEVSLVTSFFHSW